MVEVPCEYGKRVGGVACDAFVDGGDIGIVLSVEGAVCIGIA
jgi:hypothetical protein